MSPGPDLLGERLTSRYDELSAAERTVADFMRAHLGELAVYNGTELAALSGVSKATVSRLYRRLGFSGADEVRAHLRALRADGLPVLVGVPAVDDEHLAHEVANLRTALAGNDLRGTAELLAHARRVVVVGFRTSYPVALHLRTQLAQVRPDVLLAPAPGQTVAEELVGLGPEDVVVLVGFRRRPAGFAAVLGAAVASDARVVLLAEPRPHPAGVDLVLRCPVESVGPFDSYAAAESLVSRVCALTLLARPDAASRVEAIGSAQTSAGELGR